MDIQSRRYKIKIYEQKKNQSGLSFGGGVLARFNYQRLVNSFARLAHDRFSPLPHLPFVLCAIARASLNNDSD